jgi:hypothetical protein
MPLRGMLVVPDGAQTTRASPEVAENRQYRKFPRGLASVPRGAED